MSKSRKVVCIILMILSLSVNAFGQKAKYVFLFIGDGMGINQVNAANVFFSLDKAKYGEQPLLFPTFPIATFATTYSTNYQITDSAASGTAIASGNKTFQGALGVDKDTVRVKSIAEMARDKGKKIGIITSVSIEHATPAAFYAHVAKRDWNYEIGCQLAESGFDFFAGSGLRAKDADRKGNPKENIFKVIENSGYTIARGREDYLSKKDGAEKILLISKDDPGKSSLDFAIDRKEGGLNIRTMTEDAIDFLTRNNRKGFFIMVEGGIIDHACHTNDAATVFREIKDMDDAVRVAYDFYLKHPKETLIIVTADHDTGGISAGNGPGSMMRLEYFENQKQSISMFSQAMARLNAKKGKQMKWEEMKEFLGEELGFWREIDIKWEDERKLRDAFEESFVNQKDTEVSDLYTTIRKLASVARQVMQKEARIGWTCDSHTAGYVPVYAVGAGSDGIKLVKDNSQIHAVIRQAAGF